MAATKCFDHNFCWINNTHHSFNSLIFPPFQGLDVNPLINKQITLNVCVIVGFTNEEGSMYIYPIM